MKRNFMFAHFGNGLSVADTLHEKHGDYENVAHIGRDRVVKYYVDLSPEDKAIIERQAKTTDPDVSYTQTGKVFNDRPEEEDYDFSPR